MIGIITQFLWRCSVATAHEEFAAANAKKGLTPEQLVEFMTLASAHAQKALDFILPLLGRNDSCQVLRVIVLAQQALQSEGEEGVQRVLAAAHVQEFPTPNATIAFEWILGACHYACEHYTGPSPTTNAPAIPILK